MSEAFDQLLLPERKVNWRTLAASFLVQGVLALILIEAGVLHPERLAVVTQHLTYTPLVEKSSAPERVRPAFKMDLLAAPAVSGALIVPREMQVTKSRMAPMMPPKVVFAAPQLEPALVRPGGALPAIVHTGSFAGSSAQPSIVRSEEKVQTGGFGDTRGVPAQSSRRGNLVMASMGSFDTPQGTGTGNGMKGTRGVPGIVASAGFGDGIAAAGRGDGRSDGPGSIHAGGFGDATTANAGPQVHPVTAPATTPVEILSKPKPVYTEEAKRLGLQGEVLVQVLFEVGGQAHVLRVVRGLGHGLDEAAVNAASQIRFMPAQQNGHAVDSTAVVHVAFELAY